MTETRSKTWILIDNTIAILNRFDYIKVTVFKSSELGKEISKKAANKNREFYAGKVYSRFGMTLEFYRCFGKATIKKSINSVKKIKDYTYQFTMQDKTVYLIEGITDIKTNHKNGSIKMPESLIDWNKSYIDNQNNVIIVFAIYECFDTPFFDKVYNHMQKNLNGSSCYTINRAIYFKIPPDNDIKHDIWNLGNNRTITETNFSPFLWFNDFNTWIDEKKFCSLQKFFGQKAN